MKQAIVIGATGLVGNQLVNLLIDDPSYEKVIIFSRRSTHFENPKIEDHIVNFDHTEDWQNKISGDVLFSTLGTTIRKAGGKKQQYKIDYTYQFEVAKAAAENGVKNYVLVSSMGANAKSTIFYSRMKGELEEAVQKLAFKSCLIMRPSALVGDRSEERAGEKVAIKVTSFIVKMLPFLKKYKPIDARLVAQSMINAVDPKKSKSSGIYENTELFALAGE